MEVRALRVAWMPAFVIEMVCCSIASWIATWSDTSICSKIGEKFARNFKFSFFLITLSNSSIQQIPLSASISAPASTQNSPVSLSRTTPIDSISNSYIGNFETEKASHLLWVRLQKMTFLTCKSSSEGSRERTSRTGFWHTRDRPQCNYQNSGDSDLLNFICKPLYLHVEISSEGYTLLGFLVHSTKEHQKNSSLHFWMPKHRWTNTLCHL